MEIAIDSKFLLPEEIAVLEQSPRCKDKEIGGGPDLKGRALPKRILKGCGHRELFHYDDNDGQGSPGCMACPNHDCEAA